MTHPRLVEPLLGPLDADVRVPGSKSHTNRALVCAALAGGQSRLTGILSADDTEVMIRAIVELGAAVDGRAEGGVMTVSVKGTAGRLRPGPALLDVGLSGTTARFLAPVLAASGGEYVLDGAPPLRRRPMGDLIAALRGLGASIDDRGEPGHLPVAFLRSVIQGGEVEVAGDASSQFLSGLLLAAPILPAGLRIRLLTPLVSRPYVELTAETMRAFGAEVDLPPPGMEQEEAFTVAAGGYAPADVAIEPDASAASYFFAAAALCGGRVAVGGLGTATTQGDLAFVDVLQAMGAEVHRSDHRTEVRGVGPLRGVDVDLRHCSDVAQTVAAVAVFATTPTRVRGIGFIRRKETDRIGNVVAELARCGIEAHEHDDGFTVVPGEPQPAVVQTHDDHRMAMSFALLGLRSAGIQIADPDCVNKTYPGFWDDLDQLRNPG